MYKIINRIKYWIINKIRIIANEGLVVETDILIKNGLKVGINFNRQQQCIIDPNHCWLIEIGDNVTLAPRVHILAHDASTKKHLKYTKIGKVRIGNNVFVGANSIILPNINIGDNVIIGAGSVITKDVLENSIVAGNPAKVIGKTSDYINKHKKNFSNAIVYDEKWISINITEQRKIEMNRDIEGKIAYIV